MLKSIKITKLFGRFDYNINLMDNGITIITGPNGYGKSTILSFIDEFRNKTIKEVLDHTFESILFVTNSDKLLITKSNNEFKINDYCFKYSRKNKFEPDYYPRLMHLGDEEYFDMDTNEIIDFNDFHEYYMNEYFSSNEINYLLRLYNDKDKDKAGVKRTIKEISNLLKKIRREIGEVRFIKEQRLIEKRVVSNDKRVPYRGSKVEYINVIEDNAQKLVRKMEEVMGKHSELANKLDSTYITRLFDTTKELNAIDFDSNLDDLKQKQNKLNHYGLAEIKNTSTLRYMPEFAKALFVYFKDAKEKYRVFENLITKLDLYENIVNNKLAFKKMVLSRKDGICVNTEDGNKLPLTSLSSGEQEILVLYYKLIFESDVNLLLIDEPEISLHVAWQKEILDDFKKVVAVNKDVQIIISTHSPMLLSGNMDINIDLGEQYNG